MVFIKNEDLRLEDIPDDVSDVEKVRQFKNSFDLSSIKSIKASHKEFMRFLKGEQLSLTELRAALWGALDLNRWFNIEDKEKESDERIIRILKEIKTKVENKEF